jgi:WD40 repeat protein
VSISPDGTLVASTVIDAQRQDPTSMDGELWDWRAGTTRTIDGERALSAVEFDRQGRRVVFAHWNEGGAELRDVATGALLATLASTPTISDMAFSADDSLVLTANEDGQVRIWDAATGVQRGTVPVGPGGVDSLAVSEDGRRLATASGDGMVRVFALDVDDLVEIAEQHLTRPLDDDECRQFLHLDRCPA